MGSRNPQQNSQEIGLLFFQGDRKGVGAHKNDRNEIGYEVIRKQLKSLV
uniref:Uncharacterized protein n=1 Tax=Populus trichocarpa TaxID=3694 RepID=A9PH16_POPTR|nr:unknown [Populus trichocarpa]